MFEERALSYNGGASVSVGRVSEAEDARVYRFSLICILAVLKWNEQRALGYLLGGLLV